MSRFRLSLLGWNALEVVCILFRQHTRRHLASARPCLVMLILIIWLRCPPVLPPSKYIFFPFVMNDLWDVCCLVWGRGFPQCSEEDLEIFGDKQNYLVLWLFEFMRFQSVVFLQWYKHLSQNASQPHCIWKTLVWYFWKQSTACARWVQTDFIRWKRWHSYMSSELPKQFSFGFSKVV